LFHEEANFAAPKICLFAESPFFIILAEEEKSTNAKCEFENLVYFLPIMYYNNP